MKIFLVCVFLIAGTVSSASAVDYATDVYPILETYCVGCHTEDEAQGGLVMESFDAMMRGGESGLAITPGVASSSRMFLMAAGKMDPVMPPDDAEGPNEDELAVLAKWIDEGAAGPDGDMPIKRVLRTPKIEPSDSAVQPITAIARSRDGALVATGRFNSVTIGDAGGKIQTTITGDFGKVNAIEFDHSGKRILVASGLTGAYGSAAIFRTDSGDQVQEMVGHRDTLYAAVFSPDESMVATAGYDRTILLWDAVSGDVVGELAGHNGAIFDLAFSPDGRHLASACADETAKVWDVEKQQRLDTLGQPEGEVNSIAFASDGKSMVAVSSDSRLRVWEFRSRDKPGINPLRMTRFVDESPLMNLAFTPDQKAVVVVSESGNLKVIRTDDWSIAGSLEPVDDQVTDLFVSADSKRASLSLISGEVVTRDLPKIGDRQRESNDHLEPVFLDVGPLATKKESELTVQEGVAVVPRGVVIEGTLESPGQSDTFRFRAKRGEMWAIDADRTAGTMDPMVSVLDTNGDPILRTRLQAIRDTYFTFRGKNSSQVNDFRMFNWQEIGLNQFLYANGEVTKTMLWPRGPDSGFEMYPGRGNRHTFFGTTHTTHALNEPAYIVCELMPGEEPPANGLPLFEIFYENDDDPTRVAGQSSRLLFQAPGDGEYWVRIADNRGQGSADAGYRLKIRPAAPTFVPSVGNVNPTIRPGGGREVNCQVRRVDGFDGPVTFAIDSLPHGWHSTFPITVESGQPLATGMIWVDPEIKSWETPVDLSLTATANIRGVHVERPAGVVKGMVLGEPASAVPTIHPLDRELDDQDFANQRSFVLEVERGSTVSARVLLRRKEGFDKEVPLGKEFAARNPTHGIYVDNIGLNGLLVRKGETEREFFLTADPVARPGPRTFFLTAGVDGGIAGPPITVLVK